MSKLMDPCLLQKLWKKHNQKHFDTTKKSTTDALKAALKKEIQNTTVMTQVRLQEKLRWRL